MTSRVPARIGVIICSQRKPRCGDQIAHFVYETLLSTPLSEKQSALQPSLTIIDLEERALPLFNESGVPSQIKDASQYDHEHTRNWSLEVQSYDAFVFVTPQYNWGYPASIKNAIDYLYHEWKGKPAMIVSYGGHGGGKAANQLKEVLGAINMRPCETMPALSFPGRGLLVKAAGGERLGLDGKKEGGVFGPDRKTISEAYAELLQLLATPVAVRSH